METHILPNKLHQKTVELLLSSMFQGRSDRFSNQFFFGKPGAADWDKRLGATLYLDRMKLSLAALHVRQNGPHYLKSLPLSDVISKLSKFMVDNYYTISHGNCFSSFTESYNERVIGNDRHLFTVALEQSHIFKPQLYWSVFPLLAIRVGADYLGENFCIVRPISLQGEMFFTPLEERHIEPEQFPPIKNFKGRKQNPSAWICIKSPDVKSSKKMARAVLGGLSLSIMHGYKYMFSGRTMFGGECIFNEGATYSFSDQNLMPPLMHDYKLTSEDTWISYIDEKISSTSKVDQRHLKALEYYYRAWSLEPSERFPVLCMTLDAVFGDANQATQAVIDAVRSTLGAHIEQERIRLLLKLRASVIHGGAPDVYDSSKYIKYIRDYHADPIIDLELLTEKCLRKVIFEDKLREQENPNARIIANQKAQGTYKNPQDTNYIV